MLVKWEDQPTKQVVPLKADKDSLTKVVLKITMGDKHYGSHAHLMLVVLVAVDACD